MAPQRQFPTHEAGERASAPGDPAAESGARDEPEDRGPEARSVAAAVYATLRQRLMAGHYAPGEQLKEEHLAADLKVSRTPVRAALKRLTRDGMVVAETNRGVFVAEWTEQDIIEVFELRLLLEPQATALAARRATAEQVAALEALNEELAATLAASSETRVAEIQAINSRFHHTVIVAAGSPRLRTILDNLLDLPLIIGSFYFYTEPELARSLNHHRDIVTAIAQREPDYAREAMRLHLRSTYGLFMRRRRSPAAER